MYRLYMILASLSDDNSSDDFKIKQATIAIQRLVRELEPE